MPESLVLFLFMAVPAAHGSSRARGGIGAAAAGLCHSHSNSTWATSVTYTSACGSTVSLTHWVRPGIDSNPHPPGYLIGFFTHGPTMGTPGLVFFFWEVCLLLRDQSLHHWSVQVFLYVFSLFCGLTQLLPRKTLQESGVNKTAHLDGSSPLWLHIRITGEFPEPLGPGQTPYQLSRNLQELVHWFQDWTQLG